MPNPTEEPARVVILRAKLRWGSREIEHQSIRGDWPEAIERSGITYAPLLRELYNGATARELTYYEVIGNDDEA